jgi:hypothetical protein
VLHDIWDKVETLAVRHGVSRSWVIAVVLADAFGIQNQPSYLAKERKAS